eukprot:CAMPEP_0171104824 /NCGR_PEP_ID=MMETSP0766_2-20121228/61379_1 /TAXON_ID=439317 /ORGANISM="Gambierdiscus australes, Strain CAWD 149" /LENGTH=63 /DNA_ID=CAMNT_0011565515 /DNA_START=54 /DNA_END=242 /DNA_ORIENTATION=+
MSMSATFSGRCGLPPLTIVCLDQRLAWMQISLCKASGGEAQAGNPPQHKSSKLEQMEERELKK